MSSWTFLTHHAHVLLEVARDADATVQQIADRVGVTGRSAVSILNDLEAAGYLARERRGRRNHYVLHSGLPLRHPSNASHSVDEVIGSLVHLA